MAYYRTIAMAFWTDTKVVDDFTPEDKYFYLYLLTNPHTNLAGCYELSLMQASNELGYTKDVVERLINRFIQVHKIIDYDYDTKEVLIINWGKNNWTSSETYRVPVSKQIEDVKSLHFREFLIELFNASDTVSIGYQYPTDTTNTITNTNTNNNITIKSKTKDKKHIYGEYKNVRLTDSELDKLKEEFGTKTADDCITYLDEYIEMKGTKYKSHYLAIRKWVIDAVNRTNTQKKQTNKFNNFSSRSYTNEELERLIGG